MRLTSLWLAIVVRRVVRHLGARGFVVNEEAPLSGRSIRRDFED